MVTDEVITGCVTLMRDCHGRLLDNDNLPRVETDIVKSEFLHLKLV